MRYRPKYLYRVTATWTSPGRPTETRAWHYQSKRAAEKRAALLRTGSGPVVVYDHISGPTEQVAEIRPASTVTVERSERVVWTSDLAVVLREGS